MGLLGGTCWAAGKRGEVLVRVGKISIRKDWDFNREERFFFCTYARTSIMVRPNDDLARPGALAGRFLKKFNPVIFGMGTTSSFFLLAAPVPPWAYKKALIYHGPSQSMPAD